MSEKCDHGLTFDAEEARRILDGAPLSASPVHFIMGSPASAEIRRRWPRGWFTSDRPCPKGCGYVGIAYASWEHYTMGDW